MKQYDKILKYFLKIKKIPILCRMIDTLLVKIPKDFSSVHYYD